MRLVQLRPISGFCKRAPKDAAWCQVSPCWTYQNLYQPHSCCACYHDKIFSDILRVHDYIQQLLVIYETHRREVEVLFKEDIMVQADTIANAFGIELRMFRQWTSKSTAKLPEQDGGGVLSCRNLHPIPGLHNEVTRNSVCSRQQESLCSIFSPPCTDVSAGS